MTTEGELPGQNISVQDKLILADSYAENREYSPAFDLYSDVLSSLGPDDSLRQSLKTKFAYILQEFCAELENTGDTKMMFHIFCLTDRIYPECEEAKNIMGSHLFRLNMIEEAACCFREALKINPNYLKARENLENAGSHLVERWHFTMLNDYGRNSAFWHAINHAIANQGHSYVLDIGSGTGLLSMMAIQSGAASVHACEMSRVLADLSLVVISANRLDQDIAVHHMPSFDLTVGRDIPRWVDLVITETVDAGLLGEHILEIVHDAWTRLLIQTGRVIPGRAAVYVCAAECGHVRRQNRLIYPTLPHLDVDGVSLVTDVGLFGDVSGDGDGDGDGEPYTTEDLRSVPGGWRQLTESRRIFDVNFNDREQVSSLMAGLRSRFCLPVTSRGRLDALVLWFDLHLDDEHVVSSSPYQTSCWEQAIYPVIKEHFLDKGCQAQNLVVKVKDEIEIAMATRSDQINLRCLKIVRPSSQTPAVQISSSASTKTVDSTSDDISRRLQGTNLSRDYSSQSKVKDSECDNRSESQIFKTSDNDLIQKSSFIDSGDCVNQSGTSDSSSDRSNQSNIADPSSDSLSQSELNSSSRNVSGDLNQCEQVCRTDESEFSILSRSKIIDQKQDVFSLERTHLELINDLDYNALLCKTIQRFCSENQKLVLWMDGLPIVGLQALKMGASKVALYDVIDEYKKPLDRLAAINNIKHLRENQDKNDSEGTCDAENDVADRNVRGYTYVDKEFEEGQRYDVIVCDVVESCGTLKQRVFEEIAIMRLTCLRPGGAVVPRGAWIRGLLIESERLLEYNRVLDNQRTMGLCVAPFMNQFSMRNHVCLDLRTLPHKPLTSTLPLTFLNWNQAPQNPHNDQCYHMQRALLPCEITQSGRVTALVYWFDLDLDESHSVSTRGQGHWRQSAVMIDSSMGVVRGETVNIDVTLQDSVLDVRLMTSE